MLHLNGHSSCNTGSDMLKMIWIRIDSREAVLHFLYVTGLWDRVGFISHVLFCFIFFKILFIYLFLEKRREGERKGERHQCVVVSRGPLGTWPTTQACALTGNQTSDPLLLRPALNSLSHTSQGLFCFLKKINIKYLVKHLPQFAFFSFSVCQM